MAKQNGPVAKQGDPVADEPPEGAVRVPATVRAAGALAGLEGLTGLGVAVTLLVHGSAGRNSIRGPGAGAQPYGTAAWFAILALAVLAAGISLILGRRWGRAIVVIAQILLLPVAWSMLGAHRLDLAVPVGVVAVVTLALTFAPPSARWMARGYGAPPDD